MQRQLKTLSSLLILLLLAAALFIKSNHFASAYYHHLIWIVAFALFVNVSSGLTFEINTLQVLGMTLLVVSSTAHLYLTQQAGGISPVLLITIVLLFMTIPLFPQGFRQLGAVTVANYLLLTLFDIQVDNRLNAEILQTVNGLLFVVGLPCLILVYRSIRNRKKNIDSPSKSAMTRADLFNSLHRDLPTGAWNRGYLATALKRLYSDFHLVTYFYHSIVIDLDNFSELNCRFSRDLIEKTLRTFSATLMKSVGSAGYLIRIGANQFILLLVHDAPDSLMTTLELSIRLQVKQEMPEAEFAMAWGSIIQPLMSINDPEKVYLEAEKALALLKNSKKISLATIDEWSDVGSQLEFDHGDASQDIAASL